MRESVMKKLLVSLMLLVPVLSGCANIDTKITINNDRSVAVASSIAYQGDLSDSNDPTAVLIHDNYMRYLDSSYNVDKAFNSKLSTITATKKVKDISKNDLDLYSLGFVTNLPSGKFVELKKSFLAKSYNIDCTYNFPAEASKYSAKAKAAEAAPTVKKSDNKGLNPEYYQQYMDQEDIDTSNNDFAENLDDTVKQQVKSDEQSENNAESAKQNAQKQDEKTPLSVSVSVQVPALAFYNNADSSKGNLYTWNIKPDESTNIKLQYVQYSGWAIFFMILAGIVILVLGARKIIKHENQKRVGNTDNLAQ